MAGSTIGAALSHFLDAKTSFHQASDHGENAIRDELLIGIDLAERDVFGGGFHYVRRSHENSRVELESSRFELRLAASVMIKPLGS